MVKMVNTIYLIYEVDEVNFGESCLVGHVYSEVEAAKIVDYLKSSGDNDGAYYEEVEPLDLFMYENNYGKLPFMSNKEFVETQCKMVEGIFESVSEELIACNEYHYQKKEPWQRNMIQPEYNKNVLLDRVVMFMDCEQLKNREEVITEYYKAERKKMLEKGN